MEQDNRLGEFGMILFALAGMGFLMGFGKFIIPILRTSPVMVGILICGLPIPLALVIFCVVLRKRNESRYK